MFFFLGNGRNVERGKFDLCWDAIGKDVLSELEVQFHFQQNPLVIQVTYMKILRSKAFKASIKLLSIPCDSCGMNRFKIGSHDHILC